MIKKITVSTALSLAAALYAINTSASAGKPAIMKPLFIQVHYTNPISSISSADLKKILYGQVTSFKDLGGTNKPVHPYADAKIFLKLKKSYPGLLCKARSFNEEAVQSDRSFLGLSDVHGLTPCLKTLYIERTLPWGKILEDCSIEECASYPFTIDWAEPWEQDSHISIVQTGVTAMTRAFIPAVERSGDLLSPVRHTKKITSRADIAITSNEVSFLEPCTYPLKNRMLFCSPLRYFDILTEAGFDVIELTGNHNNDFGAAYNTQTIEMLKRAGMTYFGGGKNKSDADAVRYITVRGTLIAFTGFNECGPECAWATDSRAGAARLSMELFTRNIKKAVLKAAAVFVTVQWCNENDPVPQEIQKRYFHKAAEMGATIMVSSSAHRPMGLEFYRDRFISYGLGNFLFDQMQSENHRRGLIARHHLYRGRHIATELLPYMIFDYSQPRMLYGREARNLMEEVFRRSIGPVFR